MSLPSISEEQQHIVDLVRNGNNVQIDAVAGSGKTTTSLYIALSQPSTSILLLTYNAKLKMETRERKQALDLDNLHVYSYHAFCVRYFDDRAYTDTGILDFLEKKKQKAELPSFTFDQIIIDEIQDMNPLYYQMTRIVVECCETPPQLVVMGDRKQSIYQFNKADSRFLTFASEVFPSPFPWKRASLSISYRITKPVAGFLNECCRGTLPIRSVKDGPRIRYLQCNAYSRRSLREVEYYLNRGYTYSDIFVLAPSVRSARSPVRILANRLTEKNIPIFVPVSDDGKLDEDVLRNKIVFSTFHQVKGLERPVVIVFDFCHHYFKYYNKHGATETEIPNTVYVAVTRATREISLLHDETSPFFSFLDTERMEAFCCIEASKKLRKDAPTIEQDEIKEQASKTKKVLPLTEVVRYLPIETLQQALKHVELKTVRAGSFTLEVPLKSKQQDLYESVSEINSIAIPSYFEFSKHKTMTIIRHLRYETQREETSSSSSSKQSRLLLQTLTSIGIPKLLQLSTNWVALKSGFQFKSAQIRSFDWLTKDTLSMALERLQNVFDAGSCLEFEKKVMNPDFDPAFHLCAFISIYDRTRKHLWNVKTVSSLTSEHVLQTALMLWLTNSVYVEATKAFLYNIMNDEQIEICLLPSFEKSVVQLLDYKKHGEKSIEDQEFIKMMTGQKIG